MAVIGKMLTLTGEINMTLKNPAIIPIGNIGRRAVMTSLVENPTAVGRFYKEKPIARTLVSEARKVIRENDPLAHTVTSVSRDPETGIISVVLRVGTKKSPWNLIDKVGFLCAQARKKGVRLVLMPGT